MTASAVGWLWRTTMTAVKMSHIDVEFVANVKWITLHNDKFWAFPEFIIGWVQHRCVAPRLLLYGAPSMSLDRLQRSQDMLARVVTQISSRTSARPLLQSLHWLPIRERINYKVATLKFKARRMSALPYLNSLLNDHVPSRTLRLSSMPRLIIPRTCTELAKRAFSVSAPALWNSLPADVVDANSLLSFKKHLKTHLYQCAYYT